MINRGLNLYSLRHAIDTEEKFLDTALRLKGMGYNHMQFSGAPFDADMIKRVCDKSGMPVTLTHVPIQKITDETDRLIEEHLMLGCKNIGLGMMPYSAVTDKNELMRVVDKLNRAGEKMSARGMKFFYHNHHYEAYRHGGESVFDYMIKNAPYINFTLDVYWLHYGGLDVCDFMRSVKGRMDCVHLKDYMIDFKKEGEGMEPRFCPVGDGTLNFDKIVSCAIECGAKYFYVEQDNAPDFDEPFAQVERSVKYIIERGY